MVHVLSFPFLSFAYGFEWPFASVLPHDKRYLPSSLLCLSHRAEGKGIIVVEGILIFCDRGLRDLLDIKVFVDTVGERGCLLYTSDAADE